MMQDKNGFHFDFDPYNWLIQIENRQIELENKHNIAIRNQKEMAIAYNDLGKKYDALKKRFQQLETSMWQAKNKDDLIKQFYSLLGRPER